MDTVKIRHEAILESVVDAGQVAIAALAERLQVSQVTIRKDLDELERRGLIRRERGYAAQVDADDPAGRLAYHYADKRRIAATAAELVGDGEMIMIEAGSCCTLLAEAVASTRRGTTIVTNSAFIAGRVRLLPSGRTILLGGDYQPVSQVLVGPVTALCAQEFTVDTLFIGTDGFTQDTGFTGRDHLRAATVRTLATRARHVVVVTESEKFGRVSSVPLLPVDAVSAVVTDPHLPGEHRDALTRHGVALHQAQPSGAGRTRVTRRPGSPSRPVAGTP
jgi:DeoR/GlpR family transcriptional regulator of sugar metabolism